METSYLILKLNACIYLFVDLYACAHVWMHMHVHMWVHVKVRAQSVVLIFFSLSNMWGQGENVCHQVLLQKILSAGPSCLTLEIDF